MDEESYPYRAKVGSLLPEVGWLSLLRSGFNGVFLVLYTEWHLPLPAS